MTLEAIHRVSSGARRQHAWAQANISFGWPDRETINGALLAMAIQAG